MSAILEFADKLRSQIDIVDVVGGYVQLRKGGINLKGNCPLHREKTPSFTVSPAKQIFHCFGCNEGGDVIRFIQRVERLEWIEAVRMLAEKYHIPMPEFRRSESSPAEKDMRESVLTLSKLSVTHYMKRLHAAMQDESTEISQYMKRRGLDLDIVTKFQLGLAADAWQDFLEAARKAGYDRETGIGAGLIIHNQQSNRYYDRFRKRLIFPIWDALGRAIAFGARVYASDAAPDEPKYVNSPETVLYRKGQHLYALHLAKESIVREKRVLLMEGYMDVIRAHQHGFTNAVATCGTALTDEQAASLRKYCTEVTFVYDGDEAGQKAMLRGCEILLQHEFAVSVVVLPENHDPDSFLQAEGAAAFAKSVAVAQNFFSFFLSTASARFSRDTPEGKVQIVEFLLPLLSHIRNPIARQEYVRRTADYLNIDPVLIQNQLKAGPAHNLDRLRESVEEQAAQKARPIEQMFVRLLMELPESRERVVQMGFSPEWLLFPTAKKWINHCLTCSPNQQISYESLLNEASDEDRVFLREIMLIEEPLLSDDKTLKHMISRMNLNYVHYVNKLRLRQMAETEPSDQSDADILFELDKTARSAIEARNHYFLNRRQNTE